MQTRSSRPRPFAAALVALSLCGSVLLGAAAVARAADKPTAKAADVEKMQGALPDAAPAKPAQPRKVLVYGNANGFVHSSIGLGQITIAELGKKTGAYAATVTNDPAAFDDLKGYDAVVLVSTTGHFLLPKGPDVKMPDTKKMTPEEKKAAEDAARKAGEPARKEFEEHNKSYKDAEHARMQNLVDFVTKDGKGLVGIHAATDAYYDVREYGELIGGYFNGHPWNEKVGVKVDDPASPLTSMFDKNGLDVADEIYQFTPKGKDKDGREQQVYSRDKLHVLLSLDYTTPGRTAPKGKSPDNDFGVAWTRDAGKGRVFYCSLGHREEIYWNPAILKFYLAGIQFALGDLKADATPSKSAAAAPNRNAAGTPVLTADGKGTLVLAAAAADAKPPAPAADAHAVSSPPPPGVQHPPSSIPFKKIKLSDQFYGEGANIGDFNHDGKMDVVSGPYWYEGPDFAPEKRHQIYPPEAFDPHKYSDNFFTFAYDFNGDGWDDVLVYGFPDKEARLYINPKGKEGDWPVTNVLKVIDNESPHFVDVNGDGKPDIVTSNDGYLGYATADWSDPIKPWTFHKISPKGPWQKFTHGLGVGDVNGDGRMDIVVHDGWYEQPASLAGDPEWKYHKADFGPGGAQMYVYDVNGDGRNDVITSLQAHGYGLAWFEQKPDGSFEKHLIMGAKPEENAQGVVFSQPHAIDLIDVDGDGLKDIVTGKRWWAHAGGDPEWNNPAAVLYWFKLVRKPGGQVEYVANEIDADSGVGTQVVAGDVNGDKRPDIVVGNKKGTFVFVQQPK